VVPVGDSFAVLFLALAAGIHDAIYICIGMWVSVPHREISDDVSCRVVSVYFLKSPGFPAGHFSFTYTRN